MAEIVCVCLYVSPEAPCSASEHPVTVSVLIGVEDTNIQLALILMKLKWTDYNWSSTHVCMLLSLCTHMHGFAHMDLQCSALPWLRVQGLLFVCVCVCVCVRTRVFVGFSISSLILQFCDRINPVFKSLYCRNDHVLYFVVTRDSWHCSVQTVFRKPSGLGCKSVKWNHRVLSVCVCVHIYKLICVICPH